MLIGQLSTLTGVTRKAIRHYEAIGLIATPERKGSYRIYNEHDVTVIGMIRRAKDLGFTLSEIKNIVSKKTEDEKLPIEMVCQLIDTKMVVLKQEADELLQQKKALQIFKEDFVKKFI